MTQSLNFQSIIMTLQEFWARHGCLIWQPYYTQVGAGTLNPATSLRVLGPEPWNVAYVEPSIRPDDGRYGENPNRMQMHYQFQVILKPDPGNPQELYLQSLEALGIDPRQHDIRFVEDNWESPALGAWGLGWEVWLDGQEITQFTYFQQAGGQLLDPVSVEITYGLERIAIALQRVTSFRDIRWSRAAHRWRREPAGRAGAQPLLLRSGRCRAPAPDVRPVRGRSRSLPGAASWCCLPTITCSSARIPSMSWIRAAPSASPSARLSLVACATSPAAWPRPTSSSASSWNSPG